MTVWIISPLHSVNSYPDRYVPDLDRLPIFVTRLGTDVNWSEEATCFENVCAILADFYALSNPIKSNSDCVQNNLDTDGPAEDSSTSTAIPWRWMIEHVLWPSLTSTLWPSRGLLYDTPSVSSSFDESVVPSTACLRLTRLADLYKVFERC
ncbi:hypothetical protein FBUS_00243 [Fasciolopsis buskii]|uniref:DNA mismatch repair protein Mlh1 C-terminal domain-containing protein n=1 Tax=Fasciolopsis buskii TaxID=27845 RepID=A0A8E0RRW3_9TREM|nr:hypothetical protein FBUS_00243 [Fasciolopsis buski]